jgi:hypothetical protein
MYILLTAGGRRCEKVRVVGCVIFCNRALFFLGLIFFPARAPYFQNFCFFWAAREQTCEMNQSILHNHTVAPYCNTKSKRVLISTTIPLRQLQNCLFIEKNVHAFFKLFLTFCLNSLTTEQKLRVAGRTRASAPESVEGHK